jgi:tetratricopeptide (TPR) repeat protein
MAHYDLGVGLDEKSKMEGTNANYQDDAMAEYQIAIKINPKYGRAHLNLGNHLLHMRNFDAAILHFRAAIEWGNGNEELALAHHNLGNALWAKSDANIEEIIAEYRLSIQEKPNDPVTHDLLGMALRHQDRLDEAIVEFKRAVAADPDDESANEHLNDTLQRKQASAAKQ